MSNNLKLKYGKYMTKGQLFKQVLVRMHNLLVEMRIIKDEAVHAGIDNDIIAQIAQAEHIIDTVKNQLYSHINH